MKQALVLAALLAGCASVPPDVVPVTDDWGGPHVALHLTPAGGTLDYDCANGTIGSLVIGPGGRFAADGTHTPGHGGPVHVGEVLPSYPTRYDGSVQGDRMTLEGRVATGVVLGPYELRRGAPAQLFRCL